MTYDFSDKNNKYANVNYNRILIDRHIILLAHRSHIAKFYLSDKNSEAILNGIILRLIELRKKQIKIKPQGRFYHLNYPLIYLYKIY